MLSLKNIVVHYGGVQALKAVSMEINEGSITCLIGANGAGKSTTLRAISGLAPLTSGEIRFQGHRIDGMSPEEIVALGISQVPEGKKLFLEMNVRDNLLAGAYLRRNTRQIRDDIKRVCHYFPVLETAFNRPASQMSGGEQQMLAIGRGLMSNPKLLLLDEPSLGLSPLLTQEVGKIIRRIADAGMSILLIEQNAGLALKLSETGYVLETGSIAVAGKCMELRTNPHVKAAYLGIDTGSAHASAPAEKAIAPQKAVIDQPNSDWEPLAAVDSHRSSLKTVVSPTPTGHFEGRCLNDIVVNYHTTPSLSDVIDTKVKVQPGRTGGHEPIPSAPGPHRPAIQGPDKTIKVVKRSFMPKLAASSGGFSGKH